MSNQTLAARHEVIRFPPDEKTAFDALRVYEFDPALIQGENVLAMRVADWMGHGGIWRGPMAIGPVEELRQLSADIQ